MSCNEQLDGVSDNLTSMSLPVPELVSRAIDPANQSVVATFNGVELMIEDLDGMYLGSASFQLGSTPAQCPQGSRYVSLIG